MKKTRILASAAAALTLAGGGALAQGGPGVMKACAADREKFCSGITDHHAARQCMRSHMAALSHDCQAAIEAARAARAAQKAQAASVATPPAGAQPAAPPH